MDVDVYVWWRPIIKLYTNWYLWWPIHLLPQVPPSACWATWGAAPTQPPTQKNPPLKCARRTTLNLCLFHSNFYSEKIMHFGIVLSFVVGFPMFSMLVWFSPSSSIMKNINPEWKCFKKKKIPTAFHCILVTLPQWHILANVCVFVRYSTQISGNHSATLFLAAECKVWRKALPLEEWGRTFIYKSTRLNVLVCPLGQHNLLRQSGAYNNNRDQVA